MAIYVHLRHIWNYLKSTYWFIPSLMFVGAVMLAFVMSRIDETWVNQQFIDELDLPIGLYTGNAQGARSLLSTVAASVITVAGVVFSITIATLTQASSQFGPRLLRNFMSDTANQTVLGVFVATFIYCLLVLCVIRGEESGVFVPHASVSMGVVLAILSLGMLVFFIDHVSVSLQAPHVISSAARELNAAMKSLYPAELGTDAPEVDASSHPASLAADGAVIESQRGGYLQVINTELLMQLATERNLYMNIPCRPGNFVLKGATLARIEPSDAVDDALRERVCSAFLLGRLRTSEQDIEFAIEQISQIAARALSPGINDPYTAITCIDWLAASVAHIAGNGLHTPLRCDAKGVCRIVTNPSTFEGVLDASFNVIRQNGCDNPPVALRLLEAIAQIGEQVRHPRYLAALHKHAEMTYQDSLPHFAQPYDRKDLEQRFTQAMRQTEGKPSG